MGKTEQYGFVFGRFQGFHFGHLNYLLKGVSRCKHLVIGITNPDPTATREVSHEPLRSNSSSNIFSYFERYQMIKESLVDSGVSYSDFSIVPFLIDKPFLIRHYLPQDSMVYLSVLNNDQWGLEKISIFKEIGLPYQTIVDGKRFLGISGTLIRNKIRTGCHWENCVPIPVEKIIKKILKQEPERMNMK